MKKVVIFGASTVNEGSTAYNEAESLGSLLALNGYGIVNGGYSGTMEAVSKGARGHPSPYIEGIVVPDLFVARPLSGNPYLTHATSTPNLMARLTALVDASNVYIVLPGSVGTLGELVLVWNHINVDFRVHGGSKKHLICWRSPWESFIAQTVATLGLLAMDTQQIHFVNDAEEAMLLVQKLMPVVEE